MEEEACNETPTCEIQYKTGKILALIEIDHENVGIENHPYKVYILAWRVQTLSRQMQFCYTSHLGYLTPIIAQLYFAAIKHHVFAYKYSVRIGATVESLDVHFPCGLSLCSLAWESIQKRHLANRRNWGAKTSLSSWNCVPIWMQKMDKP